jgi:hypothetical protein
VWRARRLAAEYKLRGSDAVHLATAPQLGADYFMTSDKPFPRTTIDTMTICDPEPVWQLCLDDHEVDLREEAEERAIAEREAARAARAAKAGAASTASQAGRDTPATDALAATGHWRLVNPRT